jgi:predicted nucleotidyltransferase
MGHGTIREQFLGEAARFVRAAGIVPGMRRIAIIGSIVTDKPDPKDIDLLVTVTHDADLAPLAQCARRLQGTLQGLNRTADVFLIDERGRYLGRTCYWRDCRPGIRRACDALHCGRRPFLHDDLATVTLEASTIAASRVQVWPRVDVQGPVPADVNRFLEALRYPA